MLELATILNLFPDFAIPPCTTCIGKGLTETRFTIRNFEFSEDFFPSGDQVKLTQSFDLRLFIAV